MMAPPTYEAINAGQVNSRNQLHFRMHCNHTPTAAMAIAGTPTPIPTLDPMSSPSFGLSDDGALVALAV
jgi:hypothetical protein